jgi:hypothetical protein
VGAHEWQAQVQWNTLRLLSNIKYQVSKIPS